MDGIYTENTYKVQLDIELIKDAALSRWANAKFVVGNYKELGNKEYLVIQNTGVTENVNLFYAVNAESKDSEGNVIDLKTISATYSDFGDGTSSTPYTFNGTTMNELKSDLGNATELDFGDANVIITEQLSVLTSGLTSVKLGKLVTEGQSNTGAFEGCKNLTSVTMDTSELEDFVDMFKDCSSITTLQNLDLSSADNITGMYQTTGLTTANLTAESVRWASRVFKDCSNLKTAVINMPNCTDFSYMFDGCTNLTSVTVTMPSATNVSNMFDNVLTWGRANIKIITSQDVINKGIITLGKLAPNDGACEDSNFQYSVDGGKTWTDIPE